MRNVEVVSFGCRLNTYESEVIRSRALEAGLKDAVIFNTCAVTAEAMRQARQAIRRLRQERPVSRVIVTGCGAQIDPAMFANMPEVDAVLGNSEKLSASHYRDFGLTGVERVRVNSIAEVRETASHMVTGFAGHARAFVQIQNGCNHRCTFCIIPYARGPSRSVPMGAIVAQIRTLVEHGYREAVLTGVDITSYGADLPGSPTLGLLLRKILKEIPELNRLRLSSLDSVEVDADLFRAFADEPRLMPHVHLSLQSGDDLILKRMKRRHRSGDALSVCDRLRRLRPDIVFGADVIAGFPTETGEMFQNTIRHVAALGLTFLHVFPFSARPGTPAARMPQLPKTVIAERAAALRQLGARQLQQFLAQEVGRTRLVLVERGNRGHTEHFAPVRFAGDAERGSLVKSLITAAQAQHLIAQAGT
jgi:threonylcarbamoyladenosine tRNA methylthiotransferase MtaB